MKFNAIVFILFLASTLTVSAQKSGLINSGDLLKQGAILHDSTEYKKALALYDKISRSDTNYVRTLYEKALTCEADSQFTQAIKYCREGLSLKEEREFEPDFYTIYGSTLSDMKQYDEAIKIFDRGLVKYPRHSLLYFNKGIALLGQNKLHDAELIFQQTIMINPYMYSAHYQLALAAVKQGKLIPAMLSSIGYLLMTPEGRYANGSINILSAVSKSSDEVLGFKNARTEQPDANYQTVEEIVLSKIALDKQYKPIIALDDNISRQIQVIFEKLEYERNTKDFWIQYYLPYFQQDFKNGKFELLINHIFSGVNVAMIKDYNKKNKKALDAFTDEAALYFNQIRATNQLNYGNRDTVAKKYLYENGKLVGKGVLIDNKTLTGAWDIYYAAGNPRGKGMYNPAGQKEGEWKFYYFNGTLKSTEHYIAGKLQGVNEYYFENGNLSSHEVTVNGALEGAITTYYYGGAKKMDATYKAGKKDGLEKAYFASGNLKSAYNYVAGVLTGPGKEYYKTGVLKEAGTYVNGKTDGSYKTYNESGDVASEMFFTKEKVNGEWKSYHNNGKLKEKRTYIDNIEDGPHQEYYDNGQVAAAYHVKKGQMDGEANYYSRQGKVYSTIVYENGGIKLAKYMDAGGKLLSSSAAKGKSTDIVSYTADGIKKSHFSYDAQGYAGPDTVFYPSGKISQVSQYSKGELNGPVVSYYLNGNKKSEINMTNGKEDGYYQGYHVTGKLEAEGWIKNGEYQGEWVYYDSNGKLSLKRYYLDSDLSGYKEVFDPNGKKSMEQKYNADVLEKMTQYDENEKVIAVDSFPKGAGKYTLLYPNGKVQAQGTFINGNLNGVYKTFYFDGSPESTYFYKDGQMDSTYTGFYYGGNKQAERQYRVGNAIGKWKAYEEGGTLSSTTTYVNNLMNGERVYYNTDGSKDFVANYKEDDLDGIAQKFDPDGSLAYQSFYEDDEIKSYSYTGKDGKLMPFIPLSGAKAEFKSFYANGKPSREAVYSDGTKNGNVRLYYSNGQLMSDGTEIYGVNEGPSKEYYPNGKLKTELTYLADNVDGISKEYYSNGNLKKESVYLNGINHGPAKYYNENGKLTKTLIYYYGKLMDVKNEK